VCVCARACVRVQCVGIICHGVWKSGKIFPPFKTSTSKMFCVEGFPTGLCSRSRKEFRVESESVKMYRLRPRYKILNRY
jgi:hypothetical protein